MCYREVFEGLLDIQGWQYIRIRRIRINSNKGRRSTVTYYCFFPRHPERHHHGRRLATRDPEYGYKISRKGSLQPRALPQPWLLCILLRMSQEKATQSPRVCREPSKCHPKKFRRKCDPKFPQVPLVTPWAICQAREYFLASHLIIATFGCSVAGICLSLRRCVCDCLRHNSPSTSFWLSLCPAKSRRASVPSALAHSKKDLTAR
jgi:hypothetical protein